MKRRLKEYRANNQSEDGSPVLMTFFEENKIEYIQVNVENMNDEDIFNTITVFVEKVGDNIGGNKFAN